jgi:hypothetical protein
MNNPPPYSGLCIVEELPPGDQDPLHPSALHPPLSHPTRPLHPPLTLQGGGFFLAYSYFILLFLALPVFTGYRYCTLLYHAFPCLCLLYLEPIRYLLFYCTLLYLAEACFILPYRVLPFHSSTLLYLAFLVL